MSRVEGLHLWPPHTSASLTAQQVMQNKSRKSIHWGVLVTIISELTIGRSAWREGTSNRTVFMQSTNSQLEGSSDFYLIVIIYNWRCCNKSKAPLQVQMPRCYLSVQLTLNMQTIYILNCITCPHKHPKICILEFGKNGRGVSLFKSHLLFGVA